MADSVKIFFPVEMDQFYPQTAQNAMNILKRLDCEVGYDPAQTDCGKLAFENGNWDIAKKIARKFIKIFASNHPVVTPSVSVTRFIGEHYEKMFYNSGYHIEYQQIVNNIYEFCDYLYNKIDVRDIGAVFNHKAVFHDCHSASVNEAALGLLGYVNGLNIINTTYSLNGERAGNEQKVSVKLFRKDEFLESCGSGFIFSLNNDAVAAALAIRQIEGARRAGAEYIIVADVACKMQFDLILQKQKINLAVIHIVDVLASGWGKRN